MPRPRKPWSFPWGEYGSKVRIYEPRLGALLRFDYREDKKRHRPQVHPPLRVRMAPNAPVDDVLVERAKMLCKAKVAELEGGAVEPDRADSLTVGEAWALKFDPKRQALPRSRSGLTHWKASRAFWTAKLGADRRWNDVPPADVWGPLLELRNAGQVQTARKRLQNLRTLTKWLREQMRIRGLEDPTLGLRTARLMEGHTPMRPRLTPEQMKRFRAAIEDTNPRARLFLRLMTGSVTRAVQVRTLMRSGFGKPLEPPLGKDMAPHGYIVTANPVKGQPSQLLFLTRRQRDELDAAMAGYLAPWEAAYQAGEMEDYPLIPAGRLDRDALEPEPISDTALRSDLKAVLKAADIPAKSGDRVGFHALRRSMSDLVEGEEGMDTLQAAGGWTKRETIEAHGYTEREKRVRIDRARRAIEKGEG